VRVLLDECVPASVRKLLPTQHVQTVPQVGWRSSEDGPLLRFAELHIDVFLTVDRRIEHDHDLSTFKLGFVIARLRSNRLINFEAVVEDLNRAVERVRAGEVIHVGPKRFVPE